MKIITSTYIEPENQIDPLNNNKMDVNCDHETWGPRPFFKKLFRLLF